MALRVYDTLTREKRAFVPVTPGKVGMYVCGMTVQDKPHVGHIRAALSGEVMRRYLEHLGYEVTVRLQLHRRRRQDHRARDQEGLEYGSGERAQHRGLPRFAQLHNIKPATHYPRATRHIGEILALIATLIAKGYAYAAGGDVYYEVRKKADYGKLSGRDVTRCARARASRSASTSGTRSTSRCGRAPSPASRRGRARGARGAGMAHRVLGDEHEVPGRALRHPRRRQDLIFPHHENEIAQSEAATGKPFANFWTENGMVNLSGEKMSKSTGKLFFIEDIAASADPEVVRFYLLSTHYRSPIDFSHERLEEAGIAYQRLRTPLERAEVWAQPDGPGTRRRPGPRGRGGRPAVPRGDGRRLQHREGARPPLRSGART
jgi:cysteinyl-tRNA synthetase